MLSCTLVLLVTGLTCVWTQDTLEERKVLTAGTHGRRGTKIHFSFQSCSCLVNVSRHQIHGASYLIIHFTTKVVFVKHLSSDFMSVFLSANTDSCCLLLDKNQIKNKNLFCTQFIHMRTAVWRFPFCWTAPRVQRTTMSRRNTLP